MSTLATKLALAPAQVEIETRPNGEQILRSPQPLQAYEYSLVEMLRTQAEHNRETTFIAERDGDTWKRLGYGDALQRAEAIGQSLLERDLGPSRPVMLLSSNCIDMALMILGCYVSGIPVAPVSPAYALMSRDYTKLRHVVDILEPGLLYASPASAYSNAVAALDFKDTELVTSEKHKIAGWSSIEDLLKTIPGNELLEAGKNIGPDSVAKYLFTSGSTGMPKAVINTHGMICANQQMLVQCWCFLKESPPVLVDWLPWNHTFGGNKNFHLVLKHGGTLYIDTGKPLPGQMQETIRNLREISPTVYYNVPAGYAQLLPYLEQDEELCRQFFQNLQMVFFAAAALPQDIWQRIQDLSTKITGEPVLILSGWGSTETAPVATQAYFPMKSAAVVGLPVPGVEIKLVPCGSKMEGRICGPNVTPGYYKQPELTEEAFDEEGFYKIGDAVKFYNPEKPEQGLVFDGRIAEDFKLMTGTWVSVGTLRTKVIAAASPLLQDAVIAGHDRDEVCILAWLNATAAKEYCGINNEGVETADLIRHADIRKHIEQGIHNYNEANPGSSTRIVRVLLMEQPPDPDSHEITDKGYINQQAVLTNRAHLVDRLYATDTDPDIIEVQ